MGVEYRGLVCVGYTFNQLEELTQSVSYDDDSWYEFVEENNICSFSPYYDADREDCIYGLTVVASDYYSKLEITESLDDRIKSVSDTLEQKFNIKPKAYIMAHGW